MEPKRPAAPAEPEKIEVDRSKYETVTDEAALDRWIAEATAQGFVAIDTETDCIDCIIAKLAGISLATAPNTACYIPVGHSGGDLYSETPEPAAAGARAGEAEAAARRPGGAQDRAQSQIRLGDVPQGRHRRRAAGRHDGDELRPRCRGRASATASKSSPRRISITNASRSSSSAGPARSRSPSTRSRLGRRPNMRPRTPTFASGCGFG